MGEPLYSTSGGRRSSRPALPHLCAGRHARDAAGLSGAAAAGKRRQLLLRQPHRRSDGADRRAGRRSGRGGGGACRFPARRTTRSRRPIDLFGRPRAIRRASTCANEATLADLAGAAGSAPRIGWHAAPLRRAKPNRRWPARAVRNPADHRDVVGKVTEASGADDRGGGAANDAAARRLGATPVPPSAPPCWSAPPI